MNIKTKKNPHLREDLASLNLVVIRKKSFPERGIRTLSQGEMRLGHGHRHEK
jgi:hypothetical protein